MAHQRPGERIPFFVELAEFVQLVQFSVRPGIAALEQSVCRVACIHATGRLSADVAQHGVVAQPVWVFRTAIR
ncbi:MAG TPA: hypothetical protein VGN31_17225 [Paraburkholderia sp.]